VNTILVDELTKYLKTLKVKYDESIEKGEDVRADAYKDSILIFMDFFKEELDIGDIDWTKLKKKE
jgi:hypothetical protein